MLLDTSGWLCLMHQSEEFHQQARRLYKESRSRTTHSYILTEFIALATARRISRDIILEFSARVMNSQRVEIVWVDRHLHEEAFQFLTRRKDKSYSLCDAVSFLIMRERGIHRALTADHHFEQEGFERLLV